MALTASIIVPTRERAGYLDVALASIAPQAAAAGAELLVVDDGPDAATRATAERHGARYVAHDERARGHRAPPAPLAAGALPPRGREPPLRPLQGPSALPGPRAACARR